MRRATPLLVMILVCTAALSMLLATGAALALREIRAAAPAGACDSTRACENAGNGACQYNGGLKKGSAATLVKIDGSKECSLECQDGTVVWLACPAPVKS